MKLAESDYYLLGSAIAATIIGGVIGFVIAKKKYSNIYSSMSDDDIKKRILTQETLKKMAYPSTAPSPELPKGDFSHSKLIELLDDEVANVAPKTLNK